jgi:hypothetical protein
LLLSAAVDEGATIAVVPELLLPLAIAPLLLIPELVLRLEPAAVLEDAPAEEECESTLDDIMAELETAPVTAVAATLLLGVLPVL